MATVRSHLDQVLVRELPTEVAGCAECLRTGSRWVHLRLCLTCDTVGTSTTPRPAPWSG